jgi:hypothetical protein
MCRICALLIIITCGVSNAAEPVDYLKQVKPLLKSRCFACHSSLKQEGSLRLDAGSLMKLGGDSGTSVTPGDVANSPLYARLIETDESLRMPLEAKPFSKDELAIIRNWIEAGAKTTGPSNCQKSRNCQKSKTRLGNRTPSMP